MNGTFIGRAFCLLAALSSPLAHADWLQFRGPTGNGIAPEQTWKPSATPKKLWQTDVGKGISSIVVSGGRAFTMGNRDEKDTIYCFEAATGKEVWHYSYPMSVDAKLFEGGPRSTPVLDGDRLYAVSHQGDLFCLEAATGKKLWYHHYQQDFGGKRPDWGYAGSPLIKGSALYCDVGGAGASTVAVDKTSGKLLWKSGNDAAGYATPAFADFGGTETLILFKAEAVVGYAPADGRELWRTPWKTSYDINAATPLPLPGDRLFIGSGYNTGCALFHIAGGSAKELWRGKGLRTQINTAAPGKDCLFGLDGDVGGNRLACISQADGRTLWDEKSVRGGSLIESDGKLIVLSQQGELVICEASPEHFQPLARVQEFDKRCWAQPTLDGGRLFLRSNEGQLMCLDLR